MKKTTMLANSLHIGLIPDGTRRWAKNNSVVLEEAYMNMVSVVQNSIDVLYEHGAQYVSIYLLSKENLKRPESELNSVAAAETYLLENLVLMSDKKYNFDIVCAGLIENIPYNLNTAINKIKLQQNKNNLKKLFLCIAYCPYEELIGCLNNKKVDNPDKLLSNYGFLKKLIY